MSLRFSHVVSLDVSHYHRYVFPTRSVVLALDVSVDVHHYHRRLSQKGLKRILKICSKYTNEGCVIV